MSCTCNCSANSKKNKSSRIKKLEKVYNTNIITNKCPCFDDDDRPYQEGYYIKDLTQELINILDYYDDAMKQDISEINYEKEKDLRHGHLYDLEIESIKYNYSQLKNSISIGYFIRTDL